jgi:hypothetical protein
MLKKLQLSKKHLIIIVAPFFIVIAVIFFKTTFVENFISYFNTNYLLKYTITDEYIKFLSLDIQKEEKIDLNKIVSLIPVPKPKIASQVPPSKKVTITQKQEQHHLNFTYIGENKKFAEIDGNLFEEGDFISPNAKLVRIEKDKVLIDISGRKKWLYILN